MLGSSTGDSRRRRGRPGSHHVHDLNKVQPSAQAILAGYSGHGPGEYGVAHALVVLLALLVLARLASAALKQLNTW